MKQISKHIGRIVGAGLLGILCGLMLGLQVSHGQAVHPDIYLNQSSHSTYNNLSQLRSADEPEIGLYYAARTIQQNPELKKDVEDALKQWELFLLGMNLPYKVLADTTMDRAIDEPIRILIMPAAEVLSSGQRNSIRNYLARGGGLIASGRVGFWDERGVLQKDRFFKEIFSADPGVELPESLFSVVQLVQGGHPVTEGVPPGYLLKLAVPALGVSAFPENSNALGSLVVYNTEEVGLSREQIASSSMMIAGEFKPDDVASDSVNQDSVKAGRFVWTGFNPQNVSLEPEQQAIYQTMVVNALAYVSGTTAVSIRRWPHGFSSASSLAVLPSVAYQPLAYRTGMDLILSALSEARIEATYFVITDRATEHPDMLERMAEQGEIAMSADTEKMLAWQSQTQQNSRLNQASLNLAKYTSDIKGLYPPGGFFDASTFRAMVNQEYAYLLSDNQRQQAPAFLDWEKELDYRDKLLSTAEEAKEEADWLDGQILYKHVVDLQGNEQEALPSLDFETETSTEIQKRKDLVSFYPTLFSFGLGGNNTYPGTGALSDDWKASLESNFNALHQTSGLFLFAFEPETMGLTQLRAKILEDFGRYIRTQNTWIATLGEMSAWWKERSQVDVALQMVNQAGFVLELNNRNEKAVEGISLDIELPGVGDKLINIDSDELDAWTKVDSDKVLLVIESLPPGKHQVVLSDLSERSVGVLE